MSTGLADEAQELLDKLRQQRAARDKSARYSRTARARSDLASGGKFFYQLSLASGWVWAWLARPIWRACAVATSWAWTKYRWLWALVVYKRTVDDVLLFSKTRAGIMLLLFGLWLWFLLLPIAECVLIDAPLYMITAKIDEHVYLSGSQEINSSTGAHVIEGCSELPCTDRDAIYFRAENSLFNNLWSLWHGHGMFFPEYVGAAVPYATTHCVVTTYGFRLRFTTRFLNIYPEILAVACSNGKPV